MSTPRMIRRLTALITVFVAFAAIVSAQPPKARVDNVTDDYFGQKIVDPYRWMEDLKSDEMQKWMRGQADYASEYLKKLPQRQAIVSELSEISASAVSGVDYSKLRPGEVVFYTRQNPGEETSKLYRRDEKGGETLIVDPAKRVGLDSKHQTINFFVPSPDKRYVAYGLAAGGSELVSIYVFDTQTQKDLADKLTNIETAYNSPSWLPDSSGFFYARRQDLLAGAPATEIYNKTRAFLHSVNSAQSEDKFIFGLETPGVSLLPTHFPSIRTYKGSRWALAQVKKGDIEEYMLFAAPLDSVGRSGTPWKKITEFEDEVSVYTVRGDDIYLKTSKDAPTFKVLKMSLASPDISKAAVVMPASDVIIDTMLATKTGLYINVLEDGHDAIYRLAANGTQAERLTFPDKMTAYAGGNSDPDSDRVIVASASWTRGYKEFYYDPKTKQLAETGVLKVGKYDDLPGYESRDVMVKARDGVVVPLTVIFKKGIKLDGKNPTLITGYGSYGAVQYVDFNRNLLPWLDRGGVYALAHVRGGGVYGERWHKAGLKATKPNTWRDFIDCAEYLVKEKYTSPKLLAGEGTSAGGVLIGRAITERPDLFGAALIRVGLTDMLRFETTTNGVPNIQEFGSTKTESGFRELLEMSAYAHVKDGVKYPAILLTTGINDPRVDPWISGKMTARLQAAIASGRPVILRVDYDAGHGSGLTQSQYVQGQADEYAFLLANLK